MSFLPCKTNVASGRPMPRRSPKFILSNFFQSEIGAEEAEEVGVEHLLRDIKDTTVGTLSQKVTNQVKYH